MKERNLNPIFYLIAFALLFFIMENNILAQTTSELNIHSDRIKASGISSVTVYEFGYKFGNPEEDGILLEYFEYNDDGKLELVQTFNRYSEDDYEIEIIKYNSSISEVEITTEDDDDNILEKVIEKYNSSGDIIEEVEYDRTGSLKSKLNYSYNNDGTLKNISYKDSEGNIRKVVEYKYDSDGKLIEKKTLKDNQETKKIMYVYEDNKIEEIFYKPEGSIEEKYIKTYDGDNMIEEIKMDADDIIVFKASYKYDSNGNKIEKALYGLNGSSIINKIIYQYDDNGNLMKAIEYNKTNEPIKMMKYEFED